MNIFQNIWLHPRTSAAGLLIAAVTVAGVLSQQGVTLGTAGKGTVVALISALATALLGLLAKDPGGNGPSPTAGAVLLLALFVPPAFTQTTAPTGLTITTGGQALGLNIAGSWYAGADTWESLTVTPSVSVESHQLLAPSANFSDYLAGVSYNLPLQGLLDKTLLPSDTLQFFVHAGGGVVHNSSIAAPSTGPSAYAGGGLNYSPAGNGVFSVQPFRFDYVYAPGFGKGGSFALTAGIAASFGAPTTAGASANIQAHRARVAQKKAAKALLKKLT